MKSDDTSSVICVGHHLKSCVFDHGGELCLLGELSDALDEVLVAVSVVCEQLSQDGDSIKAVGIVDLFETGNDNF